MAHTCILLPLIALTGSTVAQDRPNVVIIPADKRGTRRHTGSSGAGEIRGMPARRIGELVSDGLPLMQLPAKPGGTALRAALIAAPCEWDKRQV